MEKTKETYFDALIALQDEVKNPTNSESGYNNRYRYTPLDKLLEEIKPILSKHRFVIKYFGTKDSVGAKLQHEDGECDQSELALPQFDDAQKLGSYITYLRRYQTMMLLGIMSKDEDDDGLQTTNKTTVYPKTVQEVKQIIPHKKLVSKYMKVGGIVTYNNIQWQRTKALDEKGQLIYETYFDTSPDRATRADPIEPELMAKYLEEESSWTEDK